MGANRSVTGAMRVHFRRRAPYVVLMCGRYDNLIPRDAYSALFRAVRIPRSNFPPRYNVAPTDQIPIVRIDPRDGERELTMASGASFRFG